MNWDAIGAIGEVVGAAAVFISLLYLAIQIRNSRQSDQIIAAAAATATIDAWIGQVVSNEALYDLYRRGMKDYDSLKRHEKGRFSMLLFQVLRAGETGWLQMQMGVVDAGYWSGVEVTLVDVLKTSGGSRFLEKNSRYFGTDFIAAIQKLLAEADSAENTSQDTDAEDQ